MTNGNGRPLSRVLGAAADKVAAALDPDLLWSAGGFTCRRVAFDTLTVEGPDGTVLELALPGIDLDLLR